MKTKLILATLAFVASSGFSQTQSSGIDLSNLDTSVKPGDNFYQYAAGGWLKTHPLDAEHSDNGAFTDLYELNQKRIQEIIMQYASKPQTQGTLGQKIGSLYNLMMDSVRLNREGWKPIKPMLDRIKAISDRKEYQDEAYFYNAKDEIARAYELKKGDFITVSEEAFGDSYVPVKGDMVDSAYAKASVAPATGYYGIVEDVVVTKLGRKSYRIYVAQV